MRIAVLAGLFACAVVFTASTEKSGATSFEILQNAKEPSVLTILDEVAGIPEPEMDEIAPIEPIEQKHTVTANETLSKIAASYNTSWQRIFYKNIGIANPNVITVGLELVIPTQEEELEERPIPVEEPRVVTPVAVPRPVANRSTAAPAVSRASGGGSSAGNSYVYGYCTWYVKNRRPDLPNNLGNASTWASRAAAQGYATGSQPVAGAVGQQGNHVVYIESVNGDGTVTVSEMNWKGWNIVSSRTVAASNFIYIY